MSAGAMGGSLLAAIREDIRRQGTPLPVRDFMERCIGHYYAGGDVLGRNGDFVTAPEISQIFGELLGLWCVVVWRQMGQPDVFNLVELGPGRGTMMRDALRAMRLVPECLTAVRVHMIETSAALRARQAETLAPVAGALTTPIRWPAGLADVQLAPTIVLGNEYVDALPVHQVVWHDGCWRTRCVEPGTDGGLMFVAGQPHVVGGGTRHDTALLGCFDEIAREGDVVELRDLGRDLPCLGRFGDAGLAVLLIDYGHAESAIGDTLQAVRKHGYQPPLEAPGAADLTTQVDFAALRAQLTALGLQVGPPVTQGAFLTSLGIAERASRLMTANPTEANAIEMAVGRLLSPSGMGTRFKVLGARSAHLPALPGLPA